jgi:hypothetical protein
MLLNTLPTRGITNGWATLLSRGFLSIAIGAVIGAVYGGLIMATHVATTGRFDDTAIFALGSTGVGAVVGLFIGIVYSLVAASLSSEGNQAHHRGS